MGAGPFSALAEASTVSIGSPLARMPQTRRPSSCSSRDARTRSSSRSKLSPGPDSPTTWRKPLTWTFHGYGPLSTWMSSVAGSICVRRWSFSMTVMTPGVSGVPRTARLNRSRSSGAMRLAHHTRSLRIEYESLRE